MLPRTTLRYCLRNGESAANSDSLSRRGISLTNSHQLGEYSSGQRGQIVNLLATPSKVRILLRPLFHFAGLVRFAPPVLRANRKVAALRSARNTLPVTCCPQHAALNRGLRKTDQFSRTHSRRDMFVPCTLTHFSFQNTFARRSHCVRLRRAKAA